MSVLISQFDFRKLVRCGAATTIILWTTIGWAQEDKIVFAPTPDLQELEQKVESRSNPPTVTTEEESTLVSKGYVKLGVVIGTSSGTGAGAAQKLDDSILAKVAAVGGDLVQFSKRAVPTQITQTTGPTEKKKTECANWVTDTTYTSEREPESCYTDQNNIRHCSGGGLRQVSHSTRRCTDWEKTVTEVGQETTVTISVLSSEGTIWRHDPELLAAITLQQRNAANFPKPPEQVVRDFFTTIGSITIQPNDAATAAKVEAMLKEFPGLANVKGGYYDNCPPLSEAAIRESKAVIDVLLAHGAHINGRNSHGQTALFGPVSADMAEYLISKGADVNARDNDGYTALFFLSGKYVGKYGKRVASVLRKHGGRL